MMSRPTRRLISGLGMLALVCGALRLVMSKFLIPAFKPETSRLLWDFPLVAGFLLGVGVLAYLAAGLVAAIFFAGRRTANKTAPPLAGYLAAASSTDEDRLSVGEAPVSSPKIFVKGLVPALASFVWVMVGMGAFSLVTIPVVVGLTKLVLHRV